MQTCRLFGSSYLWPWAPCHGAILGLPFNLKRATFAKGHRGLARKMETGKGNKIFKKEGSLGGNICLQKSGQIN
ncbi:hypothetical protein POVWA2_006600 [Plasmodium ovale wallikeri]|uniref:Uncharacterized protein n=1 Tax=Plasmodium ovale wallikeri TaxID=864142 RepID=A0A1A8YIB3_PLAOA|nr:hypothetical protein POVWA1_006370 [Plasmodium ovale wallikeri]SBT31885.1 hypothetical protein POVWA2_006600 [Plasmodium ovale wallikeri]